MLEPAAVRGDASFKEARRSVISLRTRQLDANVDLIHALGDGWTTDDLKAG
ncbi:hypothetical protein [Paraburkholderia mimosarum]|uniref:hypothetical protein n=1 Tax=Paraburkholderia mimosarum TaxID=312026 RepID=UPI000419E32F|nr:hypothetical protein [Paraburkholderia mimosarum]